MIAHIYVEWRLNRATEFRFRELYELYGQMEEGSEDSEAIIEQIRSLPGFPNAAPMDSDFIFVRTDKLH